MKKKSVITKKGLDIINEIVDVDDSAHFYRERA
jgi:hypothetical protein